MKRNKLIIVTLIAIVLAGVALPVSAADYYWNAIGDTPFDSVWIKMERLDPDDWTKDRFSGKWKHSLGPKGTLEGSCDWWSSNGDSMLASGTFTAEAGGIGTWYGFFVLDDTCHGNFTYPALPPYGPISGTFAGFADHSPNPYLIIYADIFESNTDLNTFAEWKRKKGFDVELQKLGDIPGVIYDEPTGRDTSDMVAIREYIRGWYNPNWVRPSYVLLVGDTRGVNEDPPFNGYEAEWADPSHLPTYQYISPDKAEGTSDYWYQLMDDNDDTADVALGRWCVNNDTELNTIIIKTLAHEKPNPAWEPNRTLLVAHHNAEKNDFNYDCADSSEVIRNLIEGWNIPGYDVFTAYGIAPPRMGGPDPEEGPNNDTIRGYLEGNVHTNGIGILNYIGHGYTGSVDHSGWWSWNAWNEYYANDTVYSLTHTHQGYPLVYQFCCAMGMIAFGDNQALCEVWTLDTNGGAAGALGLSGYNLYGGDEKSTPMFKGILSAHFEDNLDCGWAIIQGGVDFRKANIQFNGIDPTPFKKGRIFTTYWIGDPELDVWRLAPHSADISVQETGNNTYLVTVLRTSDLEPVSYAKVCMYRDGVCHMVAFTNANGQVEFPYYSNPGTYHFMASNQIGPICIRPDTVSYNVTTGFKSSGIVEDAGNHIWKLEVITPNPVASSASISYSVGQASHVEVSIYDASGREVKVLAEGNLTPGQYVETWNGQDNSGVELSSGVYFVKMKSDSYNASQRLVLVK